MILSAANLGFRALQFIFGLIVLGLAATLYRQQIFGKAPATTSYSIFSGAFGALAAIVGVVALFFQAFPGIVSIAFDALGGILLLAGGIAWAAGLKGIQCNNQDDVDSMATNGLLNGGSIMINGQPTIGVAVYASSAQAVANALTSNCHKAQADEVVQFLSFGVALVVVGLGFVLMRKGGRGSSRYVA